MQRYHLVASEEKEEEKEHERQQEGQRQRGTALPLAFGGLLLFFLLLPGFYLCSTFFSSCNPGPPWWLYALAALPLLACCVADAAFFQGVPNAFLADCPAWRKECGLRALTDGRGAEHRVALFVCGKLLLLEHLATAAMPGQLQACEPFPQFSEAPVPRAIAVLGSNVGGGIFSQHAGNDPGGGADPSEMLRALLLAGYVLQALLYGRAVLRASNVDILLLEAAGGASEALGTLGLGAGERALREVSGDGLGMAQALWEALARGLLGAVPALYFAVAGLGLAFEELGFWGCFKLCLGFVLCLLACTLRAARCLALARALLKEDRFGERSPLSGCAAGLLGTLLVVWGGCMAAKLLGAFFCESHQLDLLGGCA